MMSLIPSFIRKDSGLMEPLLRYAPLFYLLLINLAAFAVYGADKWKARHDRWRVPEKTLLLLALLGGSLGALAGMHSFHHITRKWYFRFGIPVLLVLQLLGAAAYVAWRTGSLDALFS